MQKTEHFNLNKPEVTDPLRVADFNQNCDLIDAALAAAGNCKIACGTYTGTGTYGSANPSKLTFEFTPKVVFVYQVPVYHGFTYWSNNVSYFSLYNQVFYQGGNSFYVVDYNTGSVNYTLADKALTWSSTLSAGAQMNNSGTRYAYVAIG